MSIDGINSLTPFPNGKELKSTSSENTGFKLPIDFGQSSKAASDEPIPGLQLERTTQQPPQNEDQNSVKEYEVKKGDNLWNIAKQQLIDAGIEPSPGEIVKQMRKISDANDLGLSKDLKKCKTLLPGQKLNLPAVEAEPSEITKPETGKSDKPTEPVETTKPEPGNTDKSPEPSDIGKPTEPGNTDKPEAPKEEGLTPQECNEARHYGSNVADYLVGYTDNSEQGLTKEIITQHVNSKNVLGFLAGYENNRGLGNHFFEQLGSEYGFEEKQNLLKNVAIKLSQYLKANGQPDLAREIDVALADNGFSQSELKKLDKIVQTMLVTIPELKN